MALISQFVSSWRKLILRNVVVPASNHQPESRLSPRPGLIALQRFKPDALCL